MSTRPRKIKKHRADWTDKVNRLMEFNLFNKIFPNLFQITLSHWSGLFSCHSKAFKCSILDIIAPKQSWGTLGPRWVLKTARKQSKVSILVLLFDELATFICKYNLTKSLCKVRTVLFLVSYRSLPSHLSQWRSDKFHGQLCLKSKQAWHTFESKNSFGHSNTEIWRRKQLSVFREQKNRSMFACYRIALEFDAVRIVKKN